MNEVFHPPPRQSDLERDRGDPRPDGEIDGNERLSSWPSMCVKKGVAAAHGLTGWSTLLIKSIDTGLVNNAIHDFEMARHATTVYTLIRRCWMLCKRDTLNNILRKTLDTKIPAPLNELFPPPPCRRKGDRGEEGSDPPRRHSLGPFDPPDLRGTVSSER